MQLATIGLTCMTIVGLLVSTSTPATTPTSSNANSVRHGPLASLVVNDYVLVRKESRYAAKEAEDGADGTNDGDGADGADEIEAAIYAVTEFKIDYQNNRLTRYSEYPNGVDDLTANTVFEFDKAGNLISQLDIDDKGTSSRKEFVYDDAGQLIEFNGFMASNGNQNSAWEYHYRADGKLDKKVETSGEPAKAKVFGYSDEGNLVSVTHQRGQQAGTLETTFVERFKHDPVSGQIIGQESFSKEGVSFGNSSSYHYDEHGNMIKINWFRGSDLTHTDHFFYELKRKPIFNYWLHISRFFPEWMRYEV